MRWAFFSLFLVVFLVSDAQKPVSNIQGKLKN